MLDSKSRTYQNHGMAKYRPISEQLRRAIETCGKTRYRLAKETGIDEASLSKFALGKRGLSMKALDALGKVLNLKITIEGK